MVPFLRSLFITSLGRCVLALIFSGFLGALRGPMQYKIKNPDMNLAWIVGFNNKKELSFKSYSDFEYSLNSKSKEITELKNTNKFSFFNTTQKDCKQSKSLLKEKVKAWEKINSKTQGRLNITVECIEGIESIIRVILKRYSKTAFVENFYLIQNGKILHKPYKVFRC